MFHPQGWLRRRSVGTLRKHCQPHPVRTVAIQREGQTPQLMKHTGQLRNRRLGRCRPRRCRRPTNSRRRPNRVHDPVPHVRPRPGRTTRRQLGPAPPRLARNLLVSSPIAIYGQSRFADESWHYRVTAVHTGLLVGLFWVLVWCAFLSLQIVEDGTLFSLIVSSLRPFQEVSSMRQADRIPLHSPCSSSASSSPSEVATSRPTRL